MKFGAPCALLQGDEGAYVAVRTTPNEPWPMLSWLSTYVHSSLRLNDVTHGLPGPLSRLVGAMPPLATGIPFATAWWLTWEAQELQG